MAADRPYPTVPTPNTSDRLYPVPSTLYLNPFTVHRSPFTAKRFTLRPSLNHLNCRIDQRLEKLWRRQITPRLQLLQIGHKGLVVRAPDTLNRGRNHRPILILQALD